MPPALIAHPDRIIGRALGRVLVATTTLAVIAAIGLAAPAGAAPVLLPREICLPIPIPGVPCLPDSPVPAAPVAETPAKITGTPKVDEVLTAVEPGWDNPLTTTTYQWQRDGVAIGDATKATYTVLPGDIAADITVAATGTFLIFSTVSTSAAVVGVIGDAAVATAPPSISGPQSLGGTLTADPGEWEDSPTFAYQWYRSQGSKQVAVIAGANEPTHQLTASDAGRRLAVLVTASIPGHTDGVAAAAVGPVDKLQTSATLTTARSKIKKKKRALVTVTLTSTDSGVPSGKVVIRDGKRKVGRGTASSANGRAVVKLKRLRPGTHRLVATYRGTTSYARATTSPLTITVVRR